MKWIEAKGNAHLIVKEEHTDGGDRYDTACERFGFIRPDLDVRETDELHARPFGVDTCRECHGRAKVWAANPAAAPATLTITTVTPVTIRAKTRKEREDAIHGAGLEPVSMQGGGGEAPPPVRPVRSVADASLLDDLEFPDEPAGGPATVEGAVFVTPTPIRAGRRRKATEAELDIDS